MSISSFILTVLNEARPQAFFQSASVRFHVALTAYFAR